MHHEKASSKCFVDIEEETGLSRLSKTIIQSYIHILLEFPAIAHTGIRQNLPASQGRELRKNGAGSCPDHNAVALPHMLAQLHRSLQ